MKVHYFLFDVGFTQIFIILIDRIQKSVFKYDFFVHSKNSFDFFYLPSTVRKASPETLPASLARMQVYLPLSAVVVLVISRSPSSRACSRPDNLIIRESGSRNIRKNKHMQMHGNVNMLQLRIDIMMSGV